MLSGWLNGASLFPPLCMNYDELIQHLRAQGHRLTPQRRLTLEVLQQSHLHLSAEEIARQIAVRYPSISVDMATIYRTLKWLRDNGLVAETGLGHGHMVYALLSQHHHHHLVCEHCNATFEADPAIFDAVLAELRQRYGFVARLEHLSIFGACASCQEQANNRSLLGADLSELET